VNKYCLQNRKLSTFRWNFN